jgi:hypothetical protein
MHSPGHESLVGRLSNVEFRNVGQRSRLGRYAIHFHVVGNLRQSYIKACSIHHSFNRAIAIHAVYYLRVQDNVAFNIQGHTFFIEDGREMFNVLDHNLAMLTQPSMSLLNTDQTPAAFWIVNPYNYIRNNAAVGSDHYGFWYKAEFSLNGTTATIATITPATILTATTTITTNTTTTRRRFSNARVLSSNNAATRVLQQRGSHQQ